MNGKLGGFVVVAMLALGLTASNADAATVIFTLTIDASNGNSWTLTAEASDGDNAGLAGYSVDLVNISSATSLGPTGFDTDIFKNRGFTLNNADLAGDGALFAGQNTTDAATLIYYVGQQAGTFNYFGGSEKNVPWNDPVLLGTGTAGSVPAFGQDVNANVFQSDAGVQTEAATVQTVTNVVPEPATLALLGLGALGLLARRRRHA